MVKFATDDLPSNEEHHYQLCLNPEFTRKCILRDVFGLDDLANVIEIIKAKPRLDLLPPRLLTEKKIKSVKVNSIFFKYQYKNTLKNIIIF